MPMLSYRWGRVMVVFPASWSGCRHTVVTPLLSSHCLHVIVVMLSLLYHRYHFRMVISLLLCSHHTSFVVPSNSFFFRYFIIVTASLSKSFPSFHHTHGRPCWASAQAKWVNSRHSVCRMQPKQSKSQNDHYQFWNKRYCRNMVCWYIAWMISALPLTVTVRQVLS